MPTGEAGESEYSSLLGTRYGDSMRLIIGVLRCWVARPPRKEQCVEQSRGLKEPSFGPHMGTWLFSAWGPLSLASFS